MTNNLITLTIPNDDHVALRAFGKALEEMARAYDEATDDGDVTRYDEDGNPVVLTRLKAAEERLQQVAPRWMQELRCEGDELQGKRKEPEVDTTAQQVESLAVPGATHIITEQVKAGDPIPVDGGLSQGFITKVEEITNPVDSTNTPWDERIHSASKALNVDGTWRLRRKPKDMDEAEWASLVESVKAELCTQTQVMSDEEVKGLESVEILKGLDEDKLSDTEPDTGALVDVIEPPVTPPGDDFHTDSDVVTEQAVAGIPPIPVPPPVVVPPVPREPSTETLSKALDVPYGEPEQWDFPKLMKFLTERHGKIDVPTVNQLLAVDGLAALTDLNAHPDKIGPFVARVKAHLGE